MTRISSLTASHCFAVIFLASALVPIAQGEGVYFTTPELRAAAEDLAQSVSSKATTPVTAMMGEADQKFSDGDWVLAGYVKNRNSAVTNALNPEDRAYLERNGGESFVAVNAGGIRFLVGGGQKGAVYAAARVGNDWVTSATPPLSVVGEVLRRTPAFTTRIAGAGGPHPIDDYSQPKPGDYTWAAYARDLAHAGVNLTHGVIGGQVVPDEVLKEWGIGKILVVSSCPFDSSEIRRLRQSQPGDIKPSEDPLALEGADSTLWAPCPTSDFGRNLYADWVKRTLQTHRSTEKLVFQFAEGGSVPTEESLSKPTVGGRIAGFIEILSAVVKEQAPGVEVSVSTRGLLASHIQELVELLPSEIGLYFVEPTEFLLEESGRSLGGVLYSRTWNADLVRVLEAAITNRGPKVILEISAGDTDTAWSPALGAALPATAHFKLSRALEMGCTQISLSMGGLHPWVYSPNTEVFKEIQWAPEESGEVMLARIASRDFGSASGEVLEVWNQFEAAFQNFPGLARAQRLEDFVRKGKDLATRAPLASVVEGNDWSQSVGTSVPFLLESLDSVIPAYASAVERLQRAQDSTEGASYTIAKNIRDGVFWSAFHLQLLKNQHQVVRVLNVLNWVPEGGSLDAPPWKSALVPVLRESLATAQSWRDLFFTAPEPIIRLEDTPMNAAGIDRKLDQSIMALNQFLGEASGASEPLSAVIGGSGRGQ